ncbi:ParB-like protein [Shewanella sp. phage 1/44]|uniref:ParB-like partition protein n=1 Tax=Shewanella sp. phage 1/44 TaxID=1458862 RepID=UPI0004F8764B|nr:ParB-like partition protein [Shewanella sp. phage 1/44]AHK11785.1 ParB-like protein [Shewanella sp. phage 1/44]
MSISSTYTNDKNKVTGIKATKTFNVPRALLYIEDGFNVRDICPDHVAAIRQSYEAGEYLPPIVVKDMGDGNFKIIDGHHRYHAGEGLIERYECKDYIGTDADQIAMMVTSSQGRVLSHTERAMAYLRLHRHGYTYDEIATKCKRSRADVDNHMTLATADARVFQHVKDGTITMNEVNQVIRKKGDKATEIIETAVTNATSKGEKKVKATDLHRFTPKMAMRFVELSLLLGSHEDMFTGVDDDSIEVRDLFAAYRKFKGGV